MKLYLWLCAHPDDSPLLGYSVRRTVEDARLIRAEQKRAGYDLGPLKVVTLTAPRSTKRNAKK